MFEIHFYKISSIFFVIIKLKCVRKSKHTNESHDQELITKIKLKLKSLDGVVLETGKF